MRGGARLLGGRARPVRELSKAAWETQNRRKERFMGKRTKSEKDPAMHRTTVQKRKDRSDGGSMSPSMRALILSFAGADSEGPWNPDAFSGSPATR